MRLLGNKKGQWIELGTNFIEYIAFTIAIIIVAVIGLSIMNGFSTQEQIANNPDASAVIDKIAGYPVLYDWMMVAVFFVILIGSLVVFAMAEKELLGYIISYIVTLVCSVGFGILGYVLYQFSVQDAWSVVLSQMPFTSFFISNSFIFALVYLFLSLIAIHIPKR